MSRADADAATDAVAGQELPPPIVAPAGAPPAAIEPPEPGFGAWWMVFVLFAFYANAHIDRVIIAHLVDPIARSLKIGDFGMGLILGPAFAFAFSLAALPAGWVVDRFDRRWVVGGAMFFWSLMTIASGLATSLAWLMAARMMVAVGESFLTPGAYALIADRFPRRRLSSAMAAYNMGNKAGTSIAFFAAAAAFAGALALRTSWPPAAGFEMWQIVFFLVGMPGLLLAFLPLTFRGAGRPPRRAPGDAPPPALLPFLRRSWRFIVPFFIGITFVAVVAGAMVVWLPTFMQRHHGWSATQYGPWIGTLAAIAAALTVPQGMIIDRLFARGYQDAAIRYLSWMLAATIPVAAVAFFLDSPWAFLACLGLLFILVFPYPVYVGTALQLVSPPELRGRVTGLSVAVIPIFSQGLGPLAIGALTDFVFKDPKAIGLALGIVATAGIAGSFVVLRYTLPRFRSLMDEMALSGGGRAAT